MKYIERAYPWLLLAPVILPVVVWGGLIYPYLVPKTLLFYAISFAAAGAFALLVAQGRPFFWARLAKRETWIPVALLALAYAASAFGIDFYRSFWSLFARGDGLLMLTSAVASYYLILLFADRAFFERLLRVVAVVGSAAALYGIGEWLISGGRIGSLLGNAAFFAGYLGIALFATLAAARTLARGWQRAAYAGAALQVIAIILTATRGTLLALVIALLVALVHLATRASGKKRVWSARLLAALLVFGGIFFALRAELAKVPFEPVARIASLSLSDGTVSSRLFIWKNMVAEIQKTPWLGVGAEHVDVLFNRFYDPTQISEQWFDRSHNAFLDYAAQYGIGGLLLYLALIGSFFITAAREARRGDRPTAGFFVLLAVTYAVQNFFVFDTVSSFWLLLALLASFSAASGDAHRDTLPLPAGASPALWVLAFALVFLIVPASVRPALAAHDLSEAYTYQLTDVAREVRSLSRGTALATYGDLEYGYEAYDMYANNQVAALAGEARIDAYQSTFSLVSTAFQRYSYDGRTALYLAHVLSLAPQGITVDKDLLSAALERAIRSSPKREQPWYVLANLSISNANAYPPSSKERIAGYAAARDILTRYIDLVPTLSAPHFVLAQLFYASRKPAEAAAEAAKGKEYYKGNLEAARRAATYYETVLDLPNAAYFLEEVVRLDSQDAGARSDLEKIREYERSKK
ncbi:O-antigen ligase family protein [Candidatus Kaiserbacteria bacterium]|nr:O-antigen ligase family protein [Candidatus Kaiserbacteria bacterium]